MKKTARGLSLSFCHVSTTVTLNAATGKHWPFNRWHEPHYIMPSYWWLLRQDTLEACTQLVSPLGTQKSGEAPAQSHTVRRLGCCGPQHSSPEAELPQRHYTGPIGGLCTAGDGPLLLGYT